MNRTYRILRRTAAGGLAPLALAALHGCSSAPTRPTLPTQLPGFITGQAPQLQPYLKQLYAEGERNAVLNFNRLGVAAMVQGQPELAAKALDQSIQRIEAVRAGGRDIEAAKSKFSTEASKDFKGEPYEKAMVYYYRGLVYLIGGDFSNAAASFAQVNVEDSVAEAANNQADFASAKLLQAWALRCNGEGSTSKELYRQALRMRPELKDVDFMHPALAIVESGRAPRKLGSGKYQERLSWVEGGGEAATLALRSGSSDAGAAVKAESLYYQASTRGGRPVEFLLQGKANFRDGAKTAADIGSTVAAVSLINADLQQRTGNMQAAMNSSYLSLAGSLVGLFSSAVEQSTTPAADTRAWDSLPSSIWLATPRVETQAMAQLQAQPDGSAGHAPQLVGRHARCSVAWTRLAPLPDVVPGAVEAIDGTSEAVARLRKFQAALPGQL